MWHTGRWLLTLQYTPSVQSLKMGLSGCPETMVTSYQPTLCNFPRGAKTSTITWQTNDILQLRFIWLSLSEGPATGHLNTGFSWFPCVYKQMLRWFPRFQVATTCFSCSPPDLNLVFCLHVK